MNVLKISLKNFLNKPTNAFLTILLLSFSVALISLAYKLQEQLSEQLSKNADSIDMVVGAKGSPLQLIMSSVLHIDKPTGNIQYNQLEKLQKNPLVKKAIPISYGDNYKGYRLLGSTKEFSQLYGIDEIAQGRNMEAPLEVVIGSKVAERTKLNVGSEFVSSHGLVEESIEHHNHHHLKVVGIYPVTNTVIDQLIVTPLETIWDLHAHENEVAQNDKKADEVTAILVQFKNPMGFVQLPRMINQSTAMQAALTKFQLDKLYQFTGIGVQVIQLIAIIILGISFLSIYINLYKIIRERKYELALLRVYGANRFQLILLVFYEALIVALLGFLLGIGFAYLGSIYMYDYINTNYNYSINQQLFTSIDFYLFIAIIALLIITNLLNIKSILNINISKTIAHAS